jgi:hypothetical protein
MVTINNGITSTWVSNSVLFLIGIILLAIFFGFLASTANPILIALGICLLLGGILMAKPVWIIWLVMVFGMLLVGVLPIWIDEATSKVTWGISLLGFILMFISMFRVIGMPKEAKNTPVFVWMVLAYMLYVVINSIAWSSVYELFSGFKRSFQVTGLLFAMAWFRFSAKQIKLWQTFFIIVAFLQLPWAIYELVKLVPIREGVVDAYRGIVPIDVVAGTFGATLYGGGSSGEMTIFLVIVMAFLITRRREKLIGQGKFIFLFFIVLLPLFLGQTRVVVIILPIMFFTLYRREFIIRPHAALAVLTVGLILTVGAGYFYLSSSPKSIENEFFSILSYNFYEKGYEDYALNRTTALTFWFRQQGLHDPISILFGNGLGSAHELTGGHIARRYPGYGIGLTGASTLLWEEGMFGIILFLSILILVWRTTDQMLCAEEKSWIRADASAIQVAIVLFAVDLLYGGAIMENLTFQVLFFSLLGYTAVLYHYSSTAFYQATGISYSHLNRIRKRYLL